MSWPAYAGGVSAIVIVATTGIGGLAKMVAAFVKRELAPMVDAKMTDLKSSLDVRFDANDKATEAAVTAIAGVRSEQQEVRLNLATQFGGNGNGIRQAINELAESQAHLSGAFQQHVEESKGRG